LRGLSRICSKSDLRIAGFCVTGAIDAAARTDARATAATGRVVEIQHCSAFKYFQLIQQTQFVSRAALAMPDQRPLEAEPPRPSAQCNKRAYLN